MNNGITQLYNSPGGEAIFPYTVPDAILTGNDGRTLTEDLNEVSKNMYTPKLNYVNGVDDVLDTEFITRIINEAVEKNVDILKFPKEKTFIVTPNSGTDGKGEATFIIPSNLIIDLNGSTIKIKPNNLTGYKIFKFSHLAQNSILRNGILQGDRYEHEYVTGTPTNTDTHEFGAGVFLQGTNNIIENMDISLFTGDAIYMGGYSNMNWSKKLSSSNFTRNSLDENGNIIDSDHDIVSDKLFISNYISDKKIYNLKIEPYYGGETAFVRDNMITVAFYNGDTFVKLNRQNHMQEIILPSEEFDSFRIMFTNANTDFTDVIFIHESKICRNNEIRNCKLYDCRRQGISTSRNEKCKITSNTIFKIDGVLPKCGIDIEDSRYTLNGLIIENNYIYDTNNVCINCYEGFGITIKGNTLIQKGTLGCISTNYGEGLTIKDNLIYGPIRIGFNNSTRKYKSNIVECNIIKNNKLSKRECSIKNCFMSANTFEDISLIYFGNCTVDKCEFFYTLNLENDAHLQGNEYTDFRDCKINGKNLTSNRINIFAHSINNCIIDCEVLYAKIYSEICNSIIHPTVTFYIDCYGKNIKFTNNTWYLGTSTTQKFNIISSNNIKISDNTFISDSGAWYVFFSLIDKLEEYKKIFISNNIFKSINKHNQILRLEDSNNLEIKIYDNYFDTVTPSCLITCGNPVSKKIYIKDNTGEYTLPSDLTDIFVCDSFAETAVVSEVTETE